jgi:hypothetical protein
MLKVLTDLKIINLMAENKKKEEILGVLPAL